MRTVTWQSDVSGGTNVAKYNPYNGIRIPVNAHKFEGYTWGATSYDWSPRQEYQYAYAYVEQID